MKESSEALFSDSPLGEIKSLKEEREKRLSKHKIRVGLARRRLVSFFIDFLLLYGCSIGVARITVVGFLLFLDGKHLEGSQDFSNIFLQGFSVVFPSFLLFLSLLYYCGATFFWGKTIGQSLSSIEVFSRGLEGEKLLPTLRQSFLRYLGSLLSFCSLGFLFFLGAYRGQGKVFQDWLSFTEVGEHIPKRLEEVSVVELKLFRQEEKEVA